MRKLLFFSRVAFICNACFLITLLLHYIPHLSNNGISSTFIIMGRLLSLAITSVLIIIYIVLLITSPKLLKQVPPWLVLTNFLFFVAQVIFLI